jgi:hypothetical protein
MTRATLAALFRLTPDLLARFGRGLVVTLVLFLPAAVLLAVMASSWTADHAPPKRRGKGNAEYCAAIWAWLRSGLLGCGRWLLTTALPAARRCAWRLLVLLGLLLLEAWTGLRLLALVFVVFLGGFLVEVLQTQTRPLQPALFLDCGVCVWRCADLDHEDREFLKTAIVVRSLTAEGVVSTSPT